MQKISKMHRRVQAAAERRKGNEEMKSVIQATADETSDEDLKKALAVLESSPNIALPKNTWWDDATAYYQMTRQAIVDATVSLVTCIDSALASNPAIGQDQELAVLINGLQSDTQEQLRRLDSIHDSHKQYSGAVASPNESMLCIHVNAQYEECAQIHATSTVPTLTHILDKIGAMSNVLHDAALAELDAKQDPNTVTDVEFKETTHG